LDCHVVTNKNWEHAAMKKRVNNEEVNEREAAGFPVCGRLEEAVSEALGL